MTASETGAPVTTADEVAITVGREGHNSAREGTDGRPAALRNAAVQPSGIKLRSLVLPFYVPHFLFNVSLSYAIPLLPGFARDDLVASDTVIGIIVSAVGFSKMASNVPCGSIVSRFGCKFGMLMASVLGTLSCFLSAIAPNTVVLFVARALVGIAYAVYVIALQVYASAVVSPSQRGKASGLYGGCTRLASIVGPVLGGLAAHAFGVRVAFALQAVWTLLATAVIFVAYPDWRLGRREQHAKMAAPAAAAAAAGDHDRGTATPAHDSDTSTKAMAASAAAAKDTTATAAGHAKDTTATAVGHAKDTTATAAGHAKDTTATPAGHAKDATAASATNRAAPATATPVPDVNATVATGVVGTDATTATDVAGTQAPTASDVAGTDATTTGDVACTEATTTGDVAGTDATTTGDVAGTDATTTANVAGTDTTADVASTEATTASDGTILRATTASDGTIVRATTASDFSATHGTAADVAAVPSHAARCETAAGDTYGSAQATGSGALASAPSHSVSVGVGPVSSPVARSVAPKPRRRRRWQCGATFVSVVKTHARVLATVGVYCSFLTLLRESRALLFPLAAESAGMSVHEVGVVLSVAAVCDASLFWASGLIMDRHGRKANGFMTPFLMAVGFVLVGLTSSGSGWLLAGVCIVGFGNSLSAGLVFTLGSDHAPKKDRAAFLGVYRLVTDGGAIIGPLLSGIITDVGSIQVASFAAAAVGVVACAWLCVAVAETLGHGDLSDTDSEADTRHSDGSDTEDNSGVRLVRSRSRSRRNSAPKPRTDGLELVGAAAGARDPHAHVATALAVSAPPPSLASAGDAHDAAVQVTVMSPTPAVAAPAGQD